MSNFAVDLFLLSRSVIFSPTEKCLYLIGKRSRENLFASALGVGIIIGLSHAAFDLVSGSPLRSLAKGVTFPIVLVSITIVWAWTFCLLGQISAEKGDRLSVQNIFLASSTFLLPGAVPAVGLIVMPALLLGWPFVIARHVAKRLKYPPGQVFVYLVIPPIVFWCVVRSIFYFLGMAVSN